MGTTIVKYLLGSVNSLSLWTGKLVSWLIYPLIGVMTFEVLARHLFGSPQIWVADTSLWAYGTLFMIGTSYALVRKKHVAVDVIYLRLSPRGQAIIDLATLIIIFLLISALLQPSIERAMHFREIGKVSILMVWRPIIWPFAAVIPVALSLLLLQAIAELPRVLISVVRGERL